MQHSFKLADHALEKHRQHLSQFSQELAEEINQNNLKQSTIALHDLVKQHQELSQNKPLMFGKKAWETQCQAIEAEYRELKNQYENKKEKGVKNLLNDPGFKKYAWKEYQNKHPEQADKYQNLSKSYPIIKKYVQEVELAQNMERRQQQLKQQQARPKEKSKYRGQGR